MANRPVRLLPAGAVVSLSLACSLDSGNDPVAAATPLALPPASAWTDRGEIFKAGTAGDWDLYLGGGFTVSAVKRGKTYYLYYQGADGYDNVEHTVTRRAIGLATSTDGLTFRKHPNNPILTWNPTGGLEEGAASGSALVTERSEIVIYYGANTAISSSLVNADGRYAVSLDGVMFADRGIVLDHADSEVWGSGDELFPVLAIHNAADLILYYIPNGPAERARLGVGTGAAPASPIDTYGVSTGGVFPDLGLRVLRRRYPSIFGSTIPAWGPASAAHLGADIYAVFVNNNADGHADANHIDVYTMDAKAPTRLTGPVETYSPTNFSRGVVLLDAQANTWFLYYRDGDSSAYRVMTAPVRP